MGVGLRPLLEEFQLINEIDWNYLKYKKIAIDAFNTIYQFLTTIRQKDGTPLMDSKGRVTSHLQGLFYRTINLIKNNIKPVYVFDGEPPKWKSLEVEKRKKIREEAEKKYREALERKDFEKAFLYARQSARVDDYIIKSSVELLEAMGIPVIFAPSEGEAQAAYLTIKGDVDAVASQDYDSLLFGAKKVFRNVAVTGKRKLPKKNVYIEVSPEEIVLDEVLKKLGISRKGLILIGLLIGTDYNPEGIKGIGVKTAYSIVRKYKEDEDKIFKAYKWPYDIDYHEIIEFFLNPPVTDKYELKWRKPNEDKILKILVDEHDFNEERVKKALEELKKEDLSSQQRSLLDFLRKSK